MRTKTIDPKQIMSAAIRVSAYNGLENLTTRRIAKEAGVSEGVIFNYFENKTDLMVKCLYMIDNEIDAVLSKVKVNVFTLKKSVRELWFAYFNYLTEHKENAKYYRQFRHSSYYTEDVIKGQDNSLSFFTGFIMQASKTIKENTDIFWVYVIETTLNFAVRVGDGQLPSDEKAREKYFSYIMNGVGGLFKS